MNSEEISYCVRITENTAYYDNNHYLKWPPEESCIISADSIDELYESIAYAKNGWELNRNRACLRSHYEPHPFKFEVSEIYIVVEEFSEDKLKLTENYKKLIQLREEVAQKEQAQFEEQNRKDLAYAAEQKEKKDLEEYIRLQKKFGNEIKN